jgi:cell division transport system permease protein
MRALQYSLKEAAASLWRSRRSASLAVLTIAAGLFVLGFFLVVNTNLRRVLDRWSQAAELSIYLTDDITREQLQSIEQVVERSGLAAARQYVSKADAASRFRQDFPDLASTADQLDRNPFPASYEIRLHPHARAAGEVVDALANQLSHTAGVADVRYDRRLLVRLSAAIRIVGGVGAVIVLLLAVAAALTVANVVRLAAHARREEIEIMQLVGAPLVFVRGPFVAEGVLQGGGGALVAVAALWIAFLAGRGRYGQLASEALGIGGFTFLPVGQCLLLIVGGMLLGCIGGLIVARGVRSST